MSSLTAEDLAQQIASAISGDRGLNAPIFPDDLVMTSFWHFHTPCFFFCIGVSGVSDCPSSYSCFPFSISFCLPSSLPPLNQRTTLSPPAATPHLFFSSAPSLYTSTVQHLFSTNLTVYFLQKSIGLLQCVLQNQRRRRTTRKAPGACL